MTSSTHALKRVIFMGRKPSAARAFMHLVAQGIHVPLLVAPESAEQNPALHAAATAHGSLIVEDAEAYAMVAQTHAACQDIDLVISFLYPKKIRAPLYTLGTYGCVNFHPAPLPDYKSRAGYNTAILDGRTEYGVSAHFITSDAFDAGEIIKVQRFPMDSETETAYSLEAKSQRALVDLFGEVIGLFAPGTPILTTPNVGGLYLTSKQLEALREIHPERESAEEIRRKCRAFFFPPYDGATLEVNGQRFTLVDETILQDMARRLKKNV